MPVPPLVEIENASVTRGAQAVVYDLDLRIDAGEHIAILGPNGCGKSTLIKTLTRELYPLYRTDLVNRLFGREIWDVFDLRSLLGVVSNDFATPTKPISGLDIVVSNFFGSVGIWPHHQVTMEMVEASWNALERLEATHLAERMYEEMSSGEARRVLVARALVHSPKALLLDEPSTSLDLFAQQELRSAMRKLAQSGLALILVTHHLADIIPEIDRVVLMKAGRIVADGPRRELLTKEWMERLFGVQVELSERDGYLHAW
ncbi:MAG: ATP-binding cassette domain-containing protein [Bryobacteraceae bacterium]